MTLAALIARTGSLAVRALVAFHPREFRRAFGHAVVHDTRADLDAEVRRGTVHTARAAGAAVTDALRGLVVERLDQLTASRKAMQNALLSDLRHAVRTLRREPGFTTVALGTLSVGLALSIVVAVLVNAYLVRGLPYPESRRLYNLQLGSPTMPSPPGLEKLEWRSLDDVLDLSISWDLDLFNLRGGSYPEVVQGTWVTPGYVDGFAVRTAFGRGFEPSDFETGRPSVAIISHRLWQRRFNGDPAAVGRTFEAYVNDRPNEVETFTVIGVLPAQHWHLNAFTEILSPLRAPSHPYVVRVRNGVTPEAAAQRITTLVRNGSPGLPADWQAALRSTHGAYVEQIRPLLLAVSTATGLVLLIACANVGVLLTVRATRRRREMAVRQALGASSGQVTRACAAEPIVLAATATALGLGLAWGTLTLLGPVVDHYLGRPAPGGASALGLDPATTLLTVGSAVFALGLCSLVPIVVARRTPVSMALTGGQKGSTEGPAQRRARSVLIAFEVAACLTLLVGAGLTIQSALHTLRVDMGLDTRDVRVSRFALRQRAYPQPQDRLTYFERVLARAGEVTGAEGIAFANSWPLQPSPVREVGGGPSNTVYTTRSGAMGVSAGYFDLLRIPLLDGRGFAPRDRIGTEPVALVSRTLATRLWPAATAVGQQLHLAPPPNSPPSARPLTVSVVGVVGDVRHSHTDEDLADVYVPILQWPSPGVFVYLRAPGDGTAAERDLRMVLSSLDSDVGLAATRPLAEILDVQRAGSRLLAYLLVVFAAVAACLALVGIYGVIAYTVRQREREIAVRLAMGADRRRITRMFVRQGALVMVAGLAVGVAGAIGLGRLLQAQLFDVRPVDPLVIAAMTLGFGLCGLAAVALPARAAASLDPANALKE